MRDSKNGFPAVPMRLILLFLSLMIAATAHAAPLRGKVTGIVVEKEKRIMTVFNGRKALKTYRIALGGNPVGHKEQEGDSRTPEGRYIIDAKNPKSSFHLSLKVSYPNRTDRQNARRKGVSPGGAIMIHGSPGGLGTLNALGFYTDWTAGCIAVSNDEIEELFAAVKIGTPILIRP
jgi:murein L,D-transpeptidase YafK